MSPSQQSAEEQLSNGNTGASALCQETDETTALTHLKNKTLARATERRLSNQSRLTVSNASEGSQSVAASELEKGVQTTKSLSFHTGKVRRLQASLRSVSRKLRSKKKPPQRISPTRDKFRISVRLSNDPNAPMITALVDSGYSINTVSHELASTAGLKLNPTKESFYHVDGRPIQLYGEFVSEVHSEDDSNFAGCSVERFMVVEDLDNVVLGHPWLWRVNPSIDWSRGTWRVPRFRVDMTLEELTNMVHTAPCQEEELLTLHTELLIEKRKVAASKKALAKAEARASEAEARACEHASSYHEKIAETEVDEGTKEEDRAALESAEGRLGDAIIGWKHERQAYLAKLVSREKKLSIGERELESSMRLLDEDRAVLAERTKAMELVENALKEWKLSSPNAGDATLE